MAFERMRTRLRIKRQIDWKNDFGFRFGSILLSCKPFDFKPVPEIRHQTLHSKPCLHGTSYKRTEHFNYTLSTTVDFCIDNLLLCFKRTCVFLGFDALSHLAQLAKKQSLHL